MLTQNLDISGSIRVYGGSITSSLLGTASYSDSGSFSITASYTRGNAGGTASFAISASQAVTASYVSGSNVKGTVSSSFTSSYISGSGVDGTVSSSFTASYISGSGVNGTVGSSFTASYISGSNVKGTVSSASNAETASYVSGSNVKGTVATALNSTYASLVNIANSATNLEYTPTFVITGTVGYLQPFVDGTPGMLYNPSTNKFTATNLSATGSLSGSVLGTFTGSAQGAFTGSLTGSFSGSGLGNFGGVFNGAVTGSMTGSFTGVSNGTFTGSLAGALNGAGSGSFTGSFTGSFNGAHSGSFTGASSGSFTGSSAGTFTGSAQGAFTGSLTGSFSGSGNGTFNGAFSGSASGSFSGDGSNLTNLPAGAIVGLNLARIASGSVTASITPADGFIVNTKTAISGNTIITGTFIVTGASTLNGNTFITGSTSLNGSTLISGSLSTSGGFYTVGTSTLSGSTTISGGLTEVGPVSISGSFGVLGTSSLIGPVIVTGSTNILGNFTNTGNFTGAGNTLLSGSTTITGTLNTVGNTSFTGSVNISSGNLTVVGSTITTGSLNVSGGITSQIGATITGSLGVTGSMTVAGNTIVSGTLQVTSGITGSLEGTSSYAISASNAITASYVSGSSAIVQNLTVAGTASIKFLHVQFESSSVIIATGSNVFGDEITDLQTFTGSVGITGSLTTDAATRATLPNLTGSLFGTSSYAITASYVDASAVQGLNLSSISSGSATASISPVQGFVVNTPSSLSGSLEVSGAATFKNTLTSKLGTILSGSVNILGNVITSGSETISGSIAVYGTQNNFGNLILTGGLQVTGTTGLFGTASIRGTQIVTGSTALVGNSEVTGTLAASGALVSTGLTVLAGNTRISNFTEVSGTLSATGTFEVSGTTQLNAGGAGTTNIGTSTGANAFQGGVNIYSNNTLVSGSTVNIKDTNLIITSSNTVLTGSTFNLAAATSTITGSTLNVNSTSTIVNGAYLSLEADNGITVTGSLLQSGTFRVTGSSQVIGTSSVVGLTSLTGTVITTGSNIVSGSLIITGAFGLRGSFNVDNLLTVSGTAAITGALRHIGLATINGTNTSQNPFSGYALITTGSVYVSGALVALDTTLAHGGTGSVRMGQNSGSNAFQNNMQMYHKILTMTGSDTDIKTGNSLFMSSSIVQLRGASTTITASNIFLDSLILKITASNLHLRTVTGFRVTGSTSFSGSYTDVLGSFRVYGNSLLNGASTVSGTLLVSGATNLSGTLKVSESAILSSDLQVAGTASFGNNVAVAGALTALSVTSSNFYGTASYATILVTTASQAFTASYFEGTASYAYTASYLNATASQAYTASYVKTASYVAFAETAGTSSWANNSFSASYISSSGTAIIQNLSVPGTASIAYLLTTVVSSSVINLTGSNTFGSSQNNTQTLTGSTGITGSLNMQGPIYASEISGTLYGTASYAVTASYVDQTVNSASWAETASYVDTASFAQISYITTRALTASYTFESVISSLADQAFYSEVANRATHWDGEYSGSATASWAQNVVSLAGAGSATFINTGSYDSEQAVTGSLTINGNLNVLGSSTFVYVTSSQVTLTSNIITVNTLGDSIPYGGLRVVDSSSANPYTSASLLYTPGIQSWTVQGKITKFGTGSGLNYYTGSGTVPTSYYDGQIDAQAGLFKYLKVQNAIEGTASYATLAALALTASYVDGFSNISTTTNRPVRFINDTTYFVIEAGEQVIGPDIWIAGGYGIKQGTNNYGDYFPNDKTTFNIDGFLVSQNMLYDDAFVIYDHVTILNGGVIDLGGTLQITDLPDSMKTYSGKPYKYGNGFQFKK